MPYLTGLVGIPNLDRKALKKQTAISNLNFRPLVVDGLSLEHKPVASSRPSSQDPQNEISDEDKIKWDYCTPTPIAPIAEEDEHPDGVEKVTLPARVNRTKRQTGKEYSQKI